MIYYWPGPDYAIPSGGVKTHYRHVELLNKVGIPAAILHLVPGFKCSWFESTAPIVYAQDPEHRFNEAEDILVTNEILGPSTGQLAPGMRKVVFNQNCHYTFRSYPVPVPAGCPTPYRDHPEVVGTITGSPYCANILRVVFPDHKIWTIPHGIDGEVFKPGEGEKKKQITFMPRKHYDEAQVVFGYLRYMGVLDGWDVVAIDGVSEKETARIMGESLIHFNFGYPEGHTIPPFEAMACGQVVIGYGGFSSDKWMDKLGAVRIDSGNTMEFVLQAKRLLTWPDFKLREWGLDCRSNALREFSMSKEQEGVEKVWREILDSSRRTE